MKSVAFLSALAGASAASVEIPTGDIKAGSRLGSKILANAKQLTPGGRRLEQNQKQEAGAWVAQYSIRFEKCATSEEYYGGQFGGNNNNKNQNGMGVYKQRLVHFKLCPSGTCSSSSCSEGADYVIDMGLFVEAYIESKLSAQEYNCEMVRENCNCENANDDDACEWQCYYDAGLDYCEDNRNNNNNNNNNQIEFELQDAAECSELEVDNEALQYYYYQQNVGNNNQQQYYQNGQQNGQQQNQEMKLYVGPYCASNGKSIYLGTFMDEFCQYSAPDGTYEKFSYGQALPYASKSLIDEGCVSCKEPQDQNNQNNNDQQDADEVLEVCERLYEDSGKCESGLASGVTYYPNTYGCDFIHSLKAPGKDKGSGGVEASKVFAGLFAVTTVAFGGIAYYLYAKAKRQNVQLASSDGGALA